MSLAMEVFNEGPPGGMSLPPPGLRLSDLDGGIYGPGASVASTGISSQRSVIKAANSRAAGETWEDVLEYYLVRGVLLCLSFHSLLYSQFNADRGEVGFAYRLGKIYYQGSLYAAPGGIASGAESVGSVPRDYRRALHYFLQIARQTWATDPLDYKHRPMNKEETGPVGYAAPSAGYIGRMHLRAEGVEANAVIAKMWFDRGAEYDDRESHNGLGLIYRDGLLDGKKDLKKALHHFGLAATQELAEAQVNLGKHHYSECILHVSDLL
jgi:SEL1 protein